MTKNTTKTLPQPPTPKTSRGGSLFQLLESYVRMDVIFENGLPVKYIPHILYLTAIAIFYIGNTHYADRNVRRSDKTKLEVDELRADYTTLKSNYMLRSTQSEVAKEVAEMGLYESSVPPYKVVVKPE